MIDIEYIYKTISDILEPICDRIYIGYLPEQIPDKAEKYICIGIGNISDRGAYCTSTMAFMLCVREKKSNITDIRKINAIANDVTSLFPIVDDKFTLTSPSQSDISNVGSFTTIYINSDLLIKKQ